MTRIGIIQTRDYKSNYEAIKKNATCLIRMGKKETDIVCMPEQWLVNNKIQDYETEFNSFKKIARDFSMTIIPGAFYNTSKKNAVIDAPVIGPEGEFIGHQEKIHPFDYEEKIVRHGIEAKIFKTTCRFGIIICYDMVFPKVAEIMAKKGADVLLSPSRIVRRGINPWHTYVQARSLENRIPILASNVENQKFGGNSICVDLREDNGVMIPKVKKLVGNSILIREFDLKSYRKSRKKRFSDAKRFH